MEMNMPADAPLKPSFSRSRRWNIGFHVVVAVLLVFAVAAMLNYLSLRYYQRLFVSTRTNVELSTQTLTLLHSLTNQVLVTVYYDKKDDFYSDIADVLKEYHAVNPRVAIRFVDYIRNAGVAHEIRTKYNLGAATNVVIFDAGAGRPRIVPGAMVVEKVMEQLASTNRGELVYWRRPTQFLGERIFTGALLAATNPKPLKACYLQGNGEHPLDATDLGYLTCASLLQQQHVSVEPLWLVGTNTVPADCNLLIIAGPTAPMSQSELEAIEKYLNEGGRLMALLNIASAGRDTGLEKILNVWGVNVGARAVIDPNLTSPESRGNDVIVINFSKHPAVNALTGYRLQLIRPRMIGRAATPSTAGAEAPKLEEIAVSGPGSYLEGETPGREGRPLPLMVAVEKSGSRGISLADRGTTRILVAGDSFFLTNIRIDSGAARDFAALSANWLLERSFMLEGIGPRPVFEYKVLLTDSQFRAAEWILLAGLPGAVLLVGSIVWLRRRH